MSVAARAATNIAQVNPSTSTNPPVIRTGTLAVRERTAFGGRTWRSRGVELNANALAIHQPSRHITLPLGSITELERTDLMPHSLGVKCAGKLYHLSFDSDADLYDWQDDIYSRCPLGAQTTNPFNFQHTAHIGANGARGTFAEPTTLPLFEEMMGRSTAPQAITPAAAASRASGKPTTSGSARRRSNPLKGTIILNNNNNINIEGVYYVKQTGLLVGCSYEEDQGFTTCQRDTVIDNTTRQKDTGLYILFPSDGDLYAWREAIYLRSGLSSDIGSPTDFVHAMHVSYDEKTGELKGLPDQWASLAKPLVATISMQTGNNGSNGRSSRRRSQPPKSTNEALDLTSAIKSAQSAPSSPVGKSPVSTKSKSKTPTTSSSPPLFANLSRVPAPSAEHVEPSSLGEQALPGSSVGSDGTLVSYGGSPVLGSALRGSAPSKAPLTSVEESRIPSLARVQ
ncbi:hypothetical protein MD484_g5101, partial [Candolleomyces efflorescens]